MKEQVDPYQFAYKQGCGTENAVTTLVHLIAKHLDKHKTYARALFLDFSSAFNTIQTYFSEQDDPAENQNQKYFIDPRGVIVVPGAPYNININTLQANPTSIEDKIRL